MNNLQRIIGTSLMAIGITSMSMIGFVSEPIQAEASQNYYVVTTRCYAYSEPDSDCKYESSNGYWIVASSQSVKVKSCSGKFYKVSSVSAYNTNTGKVKTLYNVYIPKSCVSIEGRV